MNDREVLQALLDGKVVTDGSYYGRILFKLNGDRMEIKVRECEWTKMDEIPRLISDFVRIVEEEKWLKKDMECTTD